MTSTKAKAVIFIACMVVSFMYVFFIQKPGGNEESVIDTSAWSSSYNYDALYPYDEKTNAFLEKYNKTANFPATKENASKGNIDCKVYIQAGDFYLELIVRDDGYIFATGENNIETGKDLFVVFYDVARTIEPSITYAEAEQAWDSMQSGSVVEKNIKCWLTTSGTGKIRFDILYPADKMGG